MGGAHPGSGHDVFANAFEPSICAAAALGPNVAIPAARSASATPSTSGTSGPITTRSTSSLRANATTARRRTRRRVVGRDRLGAGIAGRDEQFGDRWVGGEAEE